MKPVNRKNTVSRHAKSVFCLLVFLFPATHSLASKPLFTSNEPLEAVLSAPIAQAYSERKKDVRLYRPGIFSYKYGSGKTNRLDVSIRTRGNFRRLNCSLPPLHLNFQKRANDSTVFERQNKLKLVGPCKTGASYQQLIGLEYLVYKLWEELSPYHFKTRLINLTYIDTAKKRKPRQATTFVIEDIDDVAKRLKRERLEQNKVNRRQMSLSQTALVEMFHLFIANTDYSTLVAPAGDNCCHNSRLLVYPEAVADAIPVPYDFDSSGFVNAPYAKPAPQYPIKKVRQRYFSGWCKEDHHFLNAIQLFRDRKSRLFDIVQDATVINDKTKQKAVQFMQDFYTLIDSPKRVDKEILKRCRGSVIKGQT